MAAAAPDDDVHRDKNDSKEVDDPSVQEKELTRFEQVDEFRAILLSDDLFLGSLRSFQRDTHGLQDGTASTANDFNDTRSDAELRRMMSILDEYQEQSYLLDAYLEELVGPPVRALQYCVRTAYTAQSGSFDPLSAHVQRLAMLLYYFCKVRGFKTILHFFPHAVEDLLPTLTMLEEPQQQRAEEKATSFKASWEMRYILLLWLSLICMIPFDLSKFDDPSARSNDKSTITRIDRLGRHFLASPGKERDAAATMMAKLFQRRDAASTHFSQFLRWSIATLEAQIQPSTFLVMGIVQTLSNVVKVIPLDALSEQLSDIRSILALISSSDESSQHARLSEHLTNNSIVNKYKAKLACRLGLKLLRPRKQSRVLKASLLSDPSQQGNLASTSSTFMASSIEKDDAEDDEDVPEEVDEYIARLIDALQDKDTVVRYSAAKGIARLCCRLPSDFVDQVTDEIMSLFSVNVFDLMGKREDLSNVSEFTWQGCCLALAELGRRGLLKGEGLGEKLSWVQKALTFDIRRGAHSVGSGVRDAACYVLWALARAHNANTIRPFASSLSQTLVCVALLDRDISIRRAASAAFQECVGRLGVFPHGIDVIRTTDFYAVSVRRNAFLSCLPRVAEHVEYRGAIIDQLINVTLCHWDVSMRELGAEAIALVVQSDVETLGEQVCTRLSEKCQARDTFTLHGSLLALAEIGFACDKDTLDKTIGLRCKTIANAALDKVKKPASRTPGTNHVLRAACRLIATCSTSSSWSSSWPAFVDMAMERQEENCHEAASEAIATVSKWQDLSERINGAMNAWRRFNVAQQQSNVRVLGAYDYRTPAHARLRQNVLLFLISLMEETSQMRSNNVETRRNAIESLTTIAEHLADENGWKGALSECEVNAVFTALLAGLEDYSTDARGDVGSWIRLACMQGLRRLLDVCITTKVGALFLTQNVFDQACAGLAKQMCERIESVRTEARSTFLHIMRRARAQDDVTLGGGEIVSTLFPPSRDDDLRDPSVLYEKIVRLLVVPSLRQEVLRGIVLGIGSQRETINRTLADRLSAFVSADGNDEQQAPIYSLTTFIDDLTNLTVANIRSNRYLVPCVQTFNVLLEDELLTTEDESTVKPLRRILSLATRSIDKVKSIPRIMAASQYTINLLRITTLQKSVLDLLHCFLLHPFPIIRASTAEWLYTQAQVCFDDVSQEAEDVLLSTSWSQETIETLTPIVQILVKELKENV